MTKLTKSVLIKCRKKIKHDKGLENYINRREYKNCVAQLKTCYFQNLNTQLSNIKNTKQFRNLTNGFKSKGKPIVIQCKIYEKYLNDSYKNKDKNINRKRIKEPIFYNVKHPTLDSSLLQK